MRELRLTEQNNLIYEVSEFFRKKNKIFLKQLSEEEAVKIFLSECCPQEIEEEEIEEIRETFFIYNPGPITGSDLVEYADWAVWRHCSPQCTTREEAFCSSKHGRGVPPIIERAQRKSARTFCEPRIGESRDRA